MLCTSHRRRFLAGRPLVNDIKQMGRRGDGHLTEAGYVILYRPDHPNANGTGMIPQHRLVMAEALGRSLLPEETVHHKNGVRSDNRLENLELWSSSQPSGQRVEDKIAWAQEILSTYKEWSKRA